MVSSYLQPKARYPSQSVLQFFSSAKQRPLVSAVAIVLEAIKNVMHTIEYFWVKIIASIEMEDRLIGNQNKSRNALVEVVLLQCLSVN